MTYFNTNHVRGRQLAEYEGKAATQDDRILAFFRKHSQASFTPSQVHHALIMSCPITSVRRSVSSLTERGLLEKTETQRQGPYGRPEYCWRLAKGQLRLI